ncbi:MAG TPA: universal stress protein [Myxococcota bacterium]
MLPFKKILVPVDFSSHSARALDYAMGLARHFDGKIYLLHSYPVHIERIAAYGMTVPENFEQECRDAAAQHLHKWVEKVSAEGVKVEAIVTPTFASEAIVKRAEQIGADLIVMGTRGLTGVSHVLLGSVAERTIRHAPCPVMTVKESDPD